MTPRQQFRTDRTGLYAYELRETTSIHKITTTSSQTKWQHWEGEVDTKYHSIQEALCNWYPLGEGKPVSSNGLALHCIDQPHSRAGPMLQSHWPAIKWTLHLLCTYFSCFVWYFLSFFLFVCLVDLLDDCFERKRNREHEFEWLGRSGMCLGENMIWFGENIIK